MWVYIYIYIHTSSSRWSTSCRAASIASTALPVCGESTAPSTSTRCDAREKRKHRLTLTSGLTRLGRVRESTAPSTSTRCEGKQKKRLSHRSRAPRRYEVVVETAAVSSVQCRVRGLRLGLGFVWLTRGLEVHPRVRVNLVRVNPTRATQDGATC